MQRLIEAITRFWTAIVKLTMRVAGSDSPRLVCRGLLRYLHLGTNSTLWITRHKTQTAPVVNRVTGISFLQYLSSHLLVKVSLPSVLSSVLENSKALYY
jgi:hypothetical protein